MHFSEREGHCRVPHSYKTEEGYRLGQWVNVQRRTNKKGLDPSRLQRLEALSGWDWDPNLSRWEEGFSRLKQFSEREGHCRVPQSYKTEEGYRLGQWVNVQRRTNKKGLDPSRLQRLLSAGCVGYFSEGKQGLDAPGPSTAPGGAFGLGLES
jgi:hypothetical protein